MATFAAGPTGWQPAPSSRSHSVSASNGSSSTTSTQARGHCSCGRPARAVARRARRSFPRAFASGSPLTAGSDGSRRSATGRQAGRIPRLPLRQCSGESGTTALSTCKIDRNPSDQCHPDGPQAALALQTGGGPIPQAIQGKSGGTMAQVIRKRRFICDGRYRIQSINAVGRHRGRIIEIEDVDRRERFHGTASKLDRLVLEAAGPSLAGSSGQSQARRLIGFEARTSRSVDDQERTWGPRSHDGLTASSLPFSNPQHAAASRRNRRVPGARFEVAGVKFLVVRDIHRGAAGRWHWRLGAPPAANPARIAPEASPPRLSSMSLSSSQPSVPHDPPPTLQRWDGGSSRGNRTVDAAVPRLAATAAEGACRSHVAFRSAVPRLDARALPRTTHSLPAVGRNPRDHVAKGRQLALVLQTGGGQSTTSGGQGTAKFLLRRREARFRLRWALPERSIDTVALLACPDVGSGRTTSQAIPSGVDALFGLAQKNCCRVLGMPPDAAKRGAE